MHTCIVGFDDVFGGSISDKMGVRKCITCINETAEYLPKPPADDDTSAL